jgi:hypothetical protein
MAEWTTGAAILAQAGAAPGSTADQAWADECAAAVNAGLDRRLTGTPYLVDPLPAELTRAAVEAGVEAYTAREASLVDRQNASRRIVADYLETIEPILARYATVGLA